MPIPYKKGESKSSFISRAVSELVKSGRKQLQAVAIAHSMWENRKKKKKGIR